MLTRLRLILLFRLGFPDLWLRWPLGIVRGIVAAASRQRFLCSFEWWIRPYYERIATDFRQVGRHGYVWDEALGVPLGPRIYNNTLTYRLYGALSPRAFRLVTLGVYLGAVGLSGAMAGHGFLALAIVLLLAGSPLGLHALVGYMVKPEVPWWAVALVAVTAALCGHWPAALCAGGVLLLANASVAVISGLFLAPLWLYAARDGGGLPGGMALLWLLPGLLKTAWRVLQAHLDGLGRDVAAEQQKVAVRSSISLRELASLGLWFGLPLLLSGASSGPATALLGGAATVFLLVNRHVLKLADTVTVQLALLTLLVALSLAGGNWLGLVGVAWFAYYQPFSAYPAMVGQSAAAAYRSALAASPAECLAGLGRVAGDYPWLSRDAASTADEVKQFLAAIPDGARVLLESDGDGRGEGSYLHFRNWADSEVALRQVELVNQFFLVRLVEPALADLYLDRFTAKILDSGTMAEVCCALGVGFVVAFGEETAAALEGAGFRPVARVLAERASELADVLHMPVADIALLATPVVSGVLEPAAGWSRIGNTLRWQARAGEEYLIRYRYHRNFRASQGGMALEVRPAPVLDGLPLRFMRVRAAIDGPLELVFKSEWLV